MFDALTVTCVRFLYPARGNLREWAWTFSSVYRIKKFHLLTDLSRSSFLVFLVQSVTRGDMGEIGEAARVTKIRLRWSLVIRTLWRALTQLITEIHHSLHTETVIIHSSPFSVTVCLITVPIHLLLSVLAVITVDSYVSESIVSRLLEKQR